MSDFVTILMSSLLMQNFLLLLYVFMEEKSSVSPKNRGDEPSLRDSAIPPLSLVFLITSSVVVFFLFRKLLFPEMSPEDCFLAPLGVIEQLSCILLLCWHHTGAGSRIWRRWYHILFFSCVLMSFFFLGVDPNILLFLWVLSLIILFWVPSDQRIFFYLFLFLFHSGHSQWGLALIIQLLGYFCLCYFFQRDSSFIELKGDFIKLLVSLCLYCLVGCAIYGPIYMDEPEKFFFILSGASILFCVLERRKVRVYNVVLGLYFLLAGMGGLLICLTEGEPWELGVFIVSFIIGFCVFVAFQRFLSPKKLHALLTLGIGVLFQFLETLPSLEDLYLLRWIRGMGLLLFLIGFILLIENAKPVKENGKEVGKEKRGRKA